MDQVDPAWQKPGQITDSSQRSLRWDTLPVMNRLDNGYVLHLIKAKFYKSGLFY